MCCYKTINIQWLIDTMGEPVEWDDKEIENFTFD